MEPVQLANPENAFEGGVLDKKWMFNAVAHMNLWHAGEVKLPSTEWGSGKILVSNTGWVVDLTKLKVPAEYRKNFREFHIEAAGANKVRIYTGTLFGQLPTGFSVGDSPMFTLPSLANNDKIFAKVTWNRTLSNTGDIVSTITTRTIEKAAAVPADDPLTAYRHYQLATVTVDGGGVVSVSQTRWGPIDDLPGTATSPYLMPPSPGDQADAQTDYYDLTVTGKGKNTAADDLAPTYDSVQMNKTGFVRFVTEDGDLKAFVRPATINSIGQITFTGPEDLAVDFPPLTFEFGTLGYTGGTPGGTVTGTWNDGFTLDLLLPYTVFGAAVTGDPGTSASVSGQGTSGDPLIFTIPRGDTGTVDVDTTLEFGTLGYTGGTPYGNITGTWNDGFTLDLFLPYTVFGTVLTGDPGTSASVSGQGTSGDPLIFTIPRGDTGTVEMGYLEELHTIGGSDFDGTQDVTSFPAAGPIGDTTPDRAAFTKVEIYSTGSDKCIRASSESGTCVEASTYSGCALSGASTYGDLLELSGGSGFGGQVLLVNNAGLLRHGGALALKPQTLAPALNAGAACSVINAATNFAVNGTNALTLGNPSGGSEDGQVKVIACTAVTAAGTATLTPTSCSGFSTVAFTAAGQSLVLQYFTTGGWIILSVRGATVA